MGDIRHISSQFQTFCGLSSPPWRHLTLHIELHPIECSLGMIILDGNPNEQASIDSKVLEAEGQSELAPSVIPATTTPAPPPYFPQPTSNTGLLAAQNHQTIIVSHLGPPNSRQQPALKRFLKAFACALLVIALMRMLVWSVNLVATPGRREPHEWSIHKPHDAVCPEFLTHFVSFHSNTQQRCESGTIRPHCPPHSDPPPRRIMSIQYPPHASPYSRSKSTYTSTQLAF